MEKHILEKLYLFLEDYKNKQDVIGVLACGSYVTGNPNKHSDLDVHLVLKDGAGYRERGNCVIDGLLIEYFANTKKQILTYFKNDYSTISPMSQTQFATGYIIKDDYGVVKELKEQAKCQLNKNFEDLDTTPNKLSLYAIWDSLDDLQSIFEENRPDFDFIYYNKLDKLLSLYLKTKKIPYNCKSIIGHLTSEIVRNKYLLEEIKDEKLVNKIKDCILLMQSSTYKRIASNSASTNIVGVHKILSYSPTNNPTRLSFRQPHLSLTS